MSNKKPNRIDLFNNLVFPDEVRSGKIRFKVWCTDLISQEDYLEKRSFLLLDFYSAFRKIFDFFIKEDRIDDAKKFYCEFTSDDEMSVTLKNKSSFKSSFIDEINKYFTPKQKDDYDSFEVEFTNDKHNIVKLTFLRGDPNEG